MPDTKPTYTEAARALRDFIDSNGGSKVYDDNSVHDIYSREHGIKTKLASLQSRKPCTACRLVREFDDAKLVESWCHVCKGIFVASSVRISTGTVVYCEKCWSNDTNEDAEELPQSLAGIDPDITDGMDVVEYLKKRWQG